MWLLVRNRFYIEGVVFYFSGRPPEKVTQIETMALYSVEREVFDKIINQ